MNISKTINQYGNAVYITGPDDWKSSSYRAFIQPIRYKTKLYMEGDHTPIGNNHNDVYLYIGPADHRLDRLDRRYRIHDKEDNRYMIDRAERIIVNDKALYIWAILRKTTEGSI